MEPRAERWDTFETLAVPLDNMKKAAAGPVISHCAPVPLVKSGIPPVRRSRPAPGPPPDISWT